MNTDHESVRPAWTIDNAAAFLFWMRTGASELPADWLDDGELAPTTDQRRTGDGDHSRRCISTDDAGRDAIDRDFDDQIIVDPYEYHAASRRSDKELGELLGLLDSLVTGNDGKESHEPA